MKIRIQPKRPRSRTPKEQALTDKMKWIIKKVRTGQLDLSKKSHAIPYKIAVSKGLIKEEKNGSDAQASARTTRADKRNGTEKE